MARMPGVPFHSVPHFNRGRAATVNIVIQHQFAGGTVAAVQNWLRNPASRVSYHFGVGRDGHIRQWVDTANTAWATGPANARSIAIGCEGVNQQFTDAQMNACARIIRWARGAHRNIPAGARGVGWHRQFMQTNCPGDPMIRQIPELVRRAGGAAPAPAPPPRPPAAPRFRQEDYDPMFYVHTDEMPAPVVIPNAFSDGNARLRCGCNNSVTVRVDWASNRDNVDIQLGYSRGAQGVAIPNGQRFIVLRQREGNGRVAVTFSR